MAPASADYAAASIQLSPAAHGTVARGDHDLAPAMGLMVGLSAALLLWAIPVVAWLLLR